VKRTKVYRPRRGIRFSDDPGKKLTAGFAGGPSVAHTRPTVAKKTLSLKKFSSTVMTGSVGRYTGNPNDFTHFAPNPGSTIPVIRTGSLSIRNSVSYGRQYERAKYNATLLGLSSSYIGTPAPYSTTVDSTLTGTFASPSWTHKSVGFNQAFVGVSLTSSYVETRTLNYWRSGSAPLESSPVPASASLFYSKQNRYQRVIVKQTASINDTQRIFGAFTAINYYPGTGTDVTNLTGSLSEIYGSAFSIYGPNQGAGLLLPCQINIPVTASGKIVDLKVWIEFVNLSGSGLNQNAPAGAGPLANVGIAIRSPNVSWGHAHPIRNDPALINVFNSNLGDFSPFASFGAIGKLMFGPWPLSNFYWNTFLLWEGMGGNTWDYDMASGSADTINMYPGWHRDRSMRTIFCDGATIPNPRHAVSTSTSGNYNGAPNSYFGFNNAWGFDVPWTSEHEYSGSNTYSAPGSPPAGWLSGPGGKNDVNEWPTTGVNYGATQIRPLYPMLDPIYQKKRYSGVANAGSGYSNKEMPLLTTTGSGQAVFAPDKWRGGRPGLRGTEISGTWNLLLRGGNGIDISSLASYQAMYFRQVRLEFLVDTWAQPPVRRRSNRGTNPRRATEQLIVSISGTDLIQHTSVSTVTGALTGGWEAFISDTYIPGDSHNEIGATFGVALNSGSIVGDYALFYRLSGTLGSISGSTPGWLLNNRFGVPQIPLSSASLVPLSQVHVSSLPPAPYISPSKLLDGPRLLVDVAQDVNPSRTLVELAADFVSGAAI